MARTWADSGQACTGLPAKLTQVEVVCAEDSVSWASLAHWCMAPVGQPNGSSWRHMGLQHTGGRLKTSLQVQRLKSRLSG